MKEQKKMRLNRYLKKLTLKDYIAQNNVQGKNYLHEYILVFLPTVPRSRKLKSNSERFHKQLIIMFNSETAGFNVKLF
jgi:hypothetical protein